MTDFGYLRPKPLHEGIEFRIEDQDGAVAVIDDVGQLAFFEPVIQGNDDGALFGGGKHAFHEFIAVIQKQADFVALPDPPVGQGIGQAVQTVGKPGVSEAFAVRNQCFGIGPLCRFPPDHPAQRRFETPPCFRIDRTT